MGRFLFKFIAFFNNKGKCPMFQKIVFFKKGFKNDARFATLMERFVQDVGSNKNTGCKSVRASFRDPKASWYIY